MNFWGLAGGRARNPRPGRAKRMPWARNPRPGRAKRVPWARNPRPGRAKRMPWARILGLAERNVSPRDPKPQKRKGGGCRTSGSGLRVSFFSKEMRGMRDTRERESPAAFGPKEYGPSPRASRLARVGAERTSRTPRAHREGEHARGFQFRV